MLKNEGGLYTGLFGVFKKGELDAVEFSLDAAQQAAVRMYGKTEPKTGRFIPPSPRSYTIAPVTVFVGDPRTFAFDLVGSAVDKVANKAIGNWKVAKADMEATIAHANATKTDPGAHYWEPEHKARSRAVAAVKIVEALTEIRAGESS